MLNSLISKLCLRATQCVLLLSLLVLNACVFNQQVPVAVKSYDSGFFLQPGMTYAVMPMKNEQAGSLEFQSYMPHLGAALNQLGLVPEHNADVTPNVFVMFTYELQPPNVTIESYEDSYAAPAYWRTVPPPWPYQNERMNIRTVKRYPKIVKIDIIDAAAWQSGSIRKLFEGQASTSALDTDMAKAVPILITALLHKGFPSTGGITKNVVVNKSADGQTIITSTE